MKILMVCLGNICRSPMAQGVMEEQIVQNELLWTVDSAGTNGYHDGEHPDPRAIREIAKIGIDISKQVSRKIRVGDLDIYDLILVMDLQNLNDLKSMCKQEIQIAKIHLISEFAFPSQNIVVPDPYYDNRFKEALDEQLKTEIANIKSNFKCNGYYLKRLNNYCGYWVRHSGWYPDKKLRLFDRTKGIWSGTNPHDKFTLFAGNLEVEHLKGDILHYSYNTVEEHFKQMEYFAKIAANELFNKGKHPYWFQIFLNPSLHFLKSYFLKFGILDGWRGLQICTISSYGTFLKYKMLSALNKINRHQI